MKPLSLLIGFILVLVGISTETSAQDVRLRYFELNREANSFVVTWQAEKEVAVQSYEVYRKTSYSTDFVKIHTVTRLLGPGKEYRYVDDQVYKSASEQVDYQLVAVYTDGNRYFFPAKSIDYTPTAVRRTWGSIKAMFQRVDGSR